MDKVGPASRMTSTGMASKSAAEPQAASGGQHNHISADGAAGAQVSRPSGPPQVQEHVAELDKLNDLLRQKQFELMQHEKMSMLGQLASGVAHEVNTPAGAILNASVDAGTHLLEFLTLAISLDQLSPEIRKWLSSMFEVLCRGGTTRSDMAARNERRRIESTLRDRYAQARRMAEIIVGYNQQALASDEVMLERLSQEPILGILEHAMALKVSSEIAQASAIKIARIVRSLRLYAHSGQGEPADVDINDSIDSMLLVMQNKIKRLARLETHFGANIPTIKCGADLLQVWTNILSNACDAIDSAHGDKMGLIEVTTESVGDCVLVKISNDGPPIAQEHLEKLFTPFFTTKGLGRGTGLGLSICKGILKRYGGTMAAANELGKVTFEVLLPKICKPSGETAPGQMLAGSVAAADSEGSACVSEKKSG